METKSKFKFYSKFNFYYYFFSLIPVGFTDADYGQSKIDHKSISGYVFMLGGGPIMWTSHKQSTTSLSSCEAELTAISDATKQALYIKKLLTSLKIPITSLLLYSDNSSAITIAGRPLFEFHARLKHYGIKLAHLQEAIASGFLKLEHRSTTIMPADILTKSLPPTRFQRLRSLLFVHS